MFRAPSLGHSASDDQELDHNLMELQKNLSCMLESNENLSQMPASSVSEDPFDMPSSSPCVLAEIQKNFRVLQLDNNAPRFEFHGLGCMQQLSKRSRKSGGGGDPPKKSRSSCFYSLVSGQKQEQLQQENIWNKHCKQEVTSVQHITIERLRSIGLYGDCLEHNAVMRLMDLFRSLHDHLTADLGFSRQNSMPSDFLFEMPVRNPMPKSLNVRHQLQVLCSKVDRFLGHQRRTLETNRNFDYDKYTECDKLLKGSASYLQCFNHFLTTEMRHRRGNFVNSFAKFNAQRLESLLIGLREWLKASHLSVHVFNWEMDLDHRYSAAMTESHRSLNERAILLAGAERMAARPRGLSAEEMLIAKKYNLENVVQCAAEQDEFLTALLANPETYFPPNVVAICAPSKVEVDMEEEWIEEYEIEEDAPSSPPRRNEREFLRFRS
ncbi:protein bag-of-marbles [Drosophila rhopaloa]|uniref:Protein bag-of-marbles n=1 Tax=Drosophila rhopaloa TaxID=1041015 RepID=A0A6P4EV18_DRORH|nr:protein bag-of-marbles [Drosophila rhopaloa]